MGASKMGVGMSLVLPRSLSLSDSVTLGLATTEVKIMVYCDSWVMLLEVLTIMEILFMISPSAQASA